MKRLLLTLICCSPLVLSSAGSFAFDSAEAVPAEHTAYQQYGPIRYYESLWSISSKLRPNRTVSIHQTLVAIYKLNPNVFINGDINHLIKNSIINVPTYQFIKLQTNHEAFVLITKYSNLKQAQVVKKESVDDSIVKQSESAEQKNPAAGVLIVQASPRDDTGLDAGLLPSNIPSNVPVSEAVQSSRVNDPTSSANAQRSDNQSLQDPDNGSSTESITSLNEEILQAKPVNDALIATDMQVSTKENNVGNGNAANDNADNETFTETASTDKSGNVMPVQFELLQDELKRVNSQLVDTIAINDDLKSGLHLLINEIDLLKNQINTDSAAQSNLLKLIEQYGIELNSSQNGAFNKTAANNQVLAWITASSTNLLIAVSLPLLFVILIFSLLLRRNNRKLLTEKNKLIGLTVAPGSDSKELPLADNSHSLEDHSQQTEKEGFAVSPDNKTDNVLSNRNKVADELGYSDLTFLVSEADAATPEVPFNEQAKMAADNFIAQPNVVVDVTENATENVAENATKSVTEHCTDTQTDDKPDADEQLPELTGDEFSNVLLSEHATAIKIAEDASDINMIKATAELNNTEKQQAEVVNNSIQPTPSSAALKLKNSANYIAIETLLQNSEGDNPDEIYTDLNIDLGLDAFSDMLSADPDIDIDDDEYGISAKLDLARAYLEIDDKARAKAILIALVENSNAQQRNEIDKLLTRF